MMRTAPMLRASEVRALRGMIRAAPAVWPYPRGETPIERAAREADAVMRAGVAMLMDIEIARQERERLASTLRDAPSPSSVAPQGERDDIVELAAAGSPTIDRAGDGQGQAPEGTRGAAAVHLVPANACPPAQSIFRDAPSPSSVAPQDDREDVETAAEFAARVAAASARRATILAKPEPIDWSRVAKAHERKAAEPRPVAASVPLAAALSPEECRRCGIPGRKGCEHQLPYVAAPIAVSPYAMRDRSNLNTEPVALPEKTNAAKGRQRGGIQALRL